MVPARPPRPVTGVSGETNKEGRHLVVQEPAFVVTKQSNTAVASAITQTLPSIRIAWQPPLFKAQPPTERCCLWSGLTPMSGSASVVSNSFGLTTAAGNR